MDTHIGGTPWIEAASPAVGATQQLRLRSAVIWSLVGGLALAACWSVIYTTPWGIGTGWDQAMYIGAARNLVAGKGLMIAWSSDLGRTLTHYPPLYPSVLALLGTTGWDPWDAARYLNAALRGVSLVLAAWLAVWAQGAADPVRSANARGNSGWSAAIAAFLMFTSVHMEFIHGSAFSDPLFLILTLSSLALATRYLASGQRAALIGAGALVAAACLTRYAGLTLVPVIALALVWWRRPGLVLFAGIACLPLAAWVVHNALTGALLVGDRGVAWHVLSARQLGQALFTATDWVLPTRLGTQLISADGEVRKLGAGVFLLIAAATGWWAWKQRRWLTSRDVRPEGDLFKRVLLLFAVLYPIGVVVSMALFDDLVQLDTRILAPVFVCLVIVVSASAPDWLSRAWRVRWLRVPIAAVLAVIAATFAVRFVTLAASAHAQGVIYSNTEWLGSATMQRVRELPAGTTVFSNAPDAVYMLAGRSAYEIPNAGHADSFASVLQQAVQSAQGPVVLVYFGDPNIAYRLPVPVDQVQQWLPTRLVETLDDGAVYDVGGAS